VIDREAATWSLMRQSILILHLSSVWSPYSSSIGSKINTLGSTCHLYVRLCLFSWIGACMQRPQVVLAKMQKRTHVLSNIYLEPSILSLRRSRCTGFQRLLRCPMPGMPISKNRFSGPSNAMQCKVVYFNFEKEDESTTYVQRESTHPLHPGK
jgi:hypothetical protein